MAYRWHVRLLIKATKIIDIHATAPPRLGSTEMMKLYENMLAKYRDDLLYHLREILKWLLNIVPILQSIDSSQRWISPSDVLQEARERRKCQPKNAGEVTSPRPGTISVMTKRRSRDRQNRNQKWFCALIIWYSLKQQPNLFESIEMQEQLWKSIATFNAIKSEDNQNETIALDDPKSCFLRWYHCYSLWKMCERLETLDSTRLSQLGINQSSYKRLAVHWQVKAEKSLRLYGQGRLISHSLRNNVANLAILIAEIGIPDEPLTQQGISCLSYVKSVIKNRQETTQLRSGASSVTRWDPENDIRSSMPRPGPWELICLEHHLPVNLGFAKNTEECMRACRKFLLSDYTFAPSWDHSRAFVVGRWWDLTTSSIICAKMLSGGLVKRRLSLASSPDESDTGLRVDLEQTVMSSAIKEPCIDSSGLKGFADNEPPELSKGETKIIQLLERIAGRSKEDPEIFNWEKRQPRIFYHPDTSVQSLEDTPNVFKLKQTSSVNVRPNIRRYFKEYALSPPDWSLETIQKIILPADLRSVSCVDFYLKVNSYDTPELGINIKGRVDPTYWDPKKGSEDKEFVDFLNSTPGLWDFYFLGRHERHPSHTTAPKSVKMWFQNGNGTDFLDRYSTSLFNILNDSVGEITFVMC